MNIRILLQDLPLDIKRFVLLPLLDEPTIYVWRHTLIDTTKYALHKMSVSTRKQLCNYSLFYVRYFITHNIIDKFSVPFLAAEMGNLRLLKSAINDKYYQRPQQKVDGIFKGYALSAAKGGHISILSWLNEQKYLKYHDKLVSMAITYNHLPVVHWLRLVFPDNTINERTLRTAITTNFLKIGSITIEILRWIHQQHPLSSAACNDITIHAIPHDRVDILEFINTIAPDVIDKENIGEAIRFNAIKCFTWIIANRTISPSVINIAICYGRLEMIKMILGKFPSLSGITCFYLNVDDRDLPALVALLAQYKLILNPKILKHYAEKPEILALLLKSGVPYTKDILTVIVMSDKASSLDIIQEMGYELDIDYIITHSSGRPHIRDWLIQHNYYKFMRTSNYDQRKTLYELNSGIEQLLDDESWANEVWDDELGDDESWADDLGDDEPGDDEQGDDE